MKDLFPRIGIVLEHLLAVSTVHGPARDEAVRLIEELKAMDASIEEVVADRVRQETEALGGKMAAIEGDQEKTRGIVFSDLMRDVVFARVTEEERPKFEALFNGAPPAAFDHDGDGKPGGSEPHPPTDNPDDMTVAQLKEWLDGQDPAIPYAGNAKKADLVDQVKAAIAATPAEDPGLPAPTEGGPQTLTGGEGNDSVDGGGA